MKDAYPAPPGWMEEREVVYWRMCSRTIDDALQQRKHLFSNINIGSEVYNVSIG